MSITKTVVSIVAATFLLSAPAFAETATTLGGASKDNSASGGSEASGTNAKSAAGSNAMKSDSNNVSSGDQGKGTATETGAQK